MSEEMEPELIQAIEELSPPLEIGQSIYFPENTAELHLEWDFIMNVPQDVAEYWITQYFGNSLITLQAQTPLSAPIKNWALRIGLVISSTPTGFGTQQFNMIIRMQKDDYRMYQSHPRELNTETNETQ